MLCVLILPVLTSVLAMMGSLEMDFFAKVSKWIIGWLYM
jgi:hypothetical protein